MIDAPTKVAGAAVISSLLAVFSQWAGAREARESQLRMHAQTVDLQQRLHRQNVDLQEATSREEQNLRFAEFLAAHQKELFSSNEVEHQRMVLIIQLTQPQRLVRDAFAKLRESSRTTSERRRWEQALHDSAYILVAVRNGPTAGYDVFVSTHPLSAEYDPIGSNPTGRIVMRSEDGATRIRLRIGR